MELFQKSAVQIASEVRGGSLSASEVAQEFLGRSKRLNPAVDALLRTNEDDVLDQAKAIDVKRQKGEGLGLLAGVPIAIKDNILRHGELATCASKILEHFKSPYDATVLSKLKVADAVLLGRANLDEFAMGSSTENSAFIKTKNPWDLGRIPGGSSGGSASAVAARMVPLALGSDTGGSIRQPASHCGIAGLKPTYGRVSRFGLVAFASSLDQIGPLANNVRDIAACLSVIEGHDPKDSTSVDTPKGIYGEKTGLKGLRLGIPKEYFVTGLDGEVAKSIEVATKLLEECGAKLVDISLPHTSYAVATYYIIATAEASSNLARFDGVRYGLRRGHSGAEPENLLDLYRSSRAQGFGPEVKRRILLGTYVLSAGYYDAYYLKALKVRTMIRNDFEKAFTQCDVMVTPTSPNPAFKFGERADDPLKMYLSDVFTISGNLAGIPGISIPCGFTKEGLPIGLQILGKPFDEGTVLNVASAFEAETDYHQRIPKIAGKG
jgi:aspartyl-tRNA(Asn)/glutamyl-tRNA(Gln) amidotransferase subunit A